MRNRLQADDVLNDIEFELVQGAISKDELGQSIQIVKQYQNKLRGEMIQDSHQLDDSQLIARLFQLNDMIVTLLQEAVAKINSLRLELRDLAQLSKDVSKRWSSLDTAESVELEQQECLGTTDSSTVGHLSEELDGRFEEVMQPESLEIEMDVRGRSIPIIGWVIQRIRIAMHDVVLFYVNRLARRQLRVNRVYSDSILRLLELCEYQQEQINELNMELRLLRASLGADGADRQVGN